MMYTSFSWKLWGSLKLRFAVYLYIRTAQFIVPFLAKSDLLAHHRCHLHSAAALRNQLETPRPKTRTTNWWHLFVSFLYESHINMMITGRSICNTFAVFTNSPAWLDGITLQNHSPKVVLRRRRKYKVKHTY